MEFENFKLLKNIIEKTSKSYPICNWFILRPRRYII